MVACISQSTTESPINIPTSTGIQTKAPTKQPILLTSTDIPTPIATLSPSPTKDPAEQVIYSPDGHLIAKKYEPYWYPTSVETIEIQSIDGSILRKIPFEGEILGSDGNVLWEIPPQGEQWTGDPHPGLSILDWSQDSQELFFYYSMFFDGNHALWMGYDLQQINIQTGIVKRVLPGNGLMVFSFSENQELLAYVRSQDEPRRIIIRDVKSGTERSIPIITNPDKELQQVGWFIWSPYTKNELVFYTLRNEWLQTFYLDINTMSMRLIYEDWVEEFWFDSWMPDNKLRSYLIPIFSTVQT